MQTSLSQSGYQQPKVLLLRKHMITEMLHTDNKFDDFPTNGRLKQRKLIPAEKVDVYFA